MQEGQFLLSQSILKLVEERDICVCDLQHFCCLLFFVWIFVEGDRVTAVNTKTLLWFCPQYSLQAELGGLYLVSGD